MDLKAPYTPDNFEAVVLPTSVCSVCVGKSCLLIDCYPLLLLYNSASCNDDEQEIVVELLNGCSLPSGYLTPIPSDNDQEMAWPSLTPLYIN